jgi:hypothetical protein
MLQLEALLHDLAQLQQEFNNVDGDHEESVELKSEGDG